MNDFVISNSSKYYPYKSYITTALTYPLTVKSAQLATQGWYQVRTVWEGERRDRGKGVAGGRGEGFLKIKKNVKSINIFFTIRISLLTCNQRLIMMAGKKEMDFSKMLSAVQKEISGEQD